MHDRTNVRSLLRLAQDVDFAVLRELSNRCWRTNYAGVIPAETLEMFLAGDDGVRWRAYRERWGGERWVAERDGRVLGYVAAGPSRDEGASAGEAEVYALFIDPDEQGRGTGRLLLDHAVAELTAGGFREAHLWVVAAAAAARGFYESRGFTPDGGAQSLMPGDVATVRYRRHL